MQHHACCIKPLGCRCSDIRARHSQDLGCIRCGVTVLPRAGAGGVWQPGTVSQDVRGEGSSSTGDHHCTLAWAGWAGLGWAGWAGLGWADQLRQNRLCHHAPAASSQAVPGSARLSWGPLPSTSNPGIEKQILGDTLIHTLMHHKHCIETSLHVQCTTDCSNHQCQGIYGILPVQYPPRLILVLTTDYSDELCEM